MSESARTQMKRILRALFHYTIEELNLPARLENVWAGIDPELRDAITNASARMGRLYVVAFGKAAMPMAAWLLDKLDGDQMSGVLSAPSVRRPRWRNLECFVGGHPTPNRGSFEAALTALELVRGATEDDLVVYLVSGGGSSLFEYPTDESIDVADLRAFYGALVLCGADIVEMNVVRKHLSAVKGGRLAEAASPARQLTLYVSDVPEGQDASVASGPTMPDTSTLEEFRRVVARYDLEKQAPPAIGALLRDPSLPETPKPGDDVFDRSSWTCVLDNSGAIEAACRFAESEGWSVLPDASVDDVGVAVAADRLLARLLEFRAIAPDNSPVCLVSGGELASLVTGAGVGGRNQAFVLECVPRIAGKRIAVMSAGTDGIDGNSPAAGAVADGRSLSRANVMDMDPGEFLRQSDSYSFFKRLGDDITCGPTQNNVRDIRVLVSW